MEPPEIMHLKLKTSEGGGGGGEERKGTEKRDN